MDSLRYWVTEMHVDGFRFDLASTLAREFYDVDRLSTFFELVQQDPVVSQVKLIAEPWDVGPGGYQVGNFPPQWTEWNGKYRDTVRDFWRGEPSLGRVRLPADRLERPLRAVGPPTGRVDQLRHRARRLHPARPGLLQRQAQRGERRGQQRRREPQPLVEPRRRGPDRRPGDPRAARPAAAQLPRHAAAQPGRADAAARRRGSAARSTATTTPTPRTARSRWVHWDEVDEPLIEFTAGVARAAPRAPDVPAPPLLHRHDGAHRQRRGRAAQRHRLAAPRRAADGGRRLERARRAVDRDVPQRPRHPEPRRPRSARRRTTTSCSTSTPARDDVPLTLPPEEYAAAWDVVIDTAEVRRRKGPMRAGVRSKVAGRSVLVLREHTSPTAAPESSAAASVAAASAAQEQNGKGDDGGMTMRVPTSTYRLQVNARFTLQDAAATLPYLHDLGVDWVYLSPLLRAEPGSDHGYDVVDHVHGRPGPRRRRGPGRGVRRGEAARDGRARRHRAEPHGRRDPARERLVVGPAAGTAGPPRTPMPSTSTGTRAAGASASRCSATTAARCRAWSTTSEGVARYHDHVFPLAPGTTDAGGAALRARALDGRRPRAQLPPVLRGQHPGRRPGRGPRSLRRLARGDPPVVRRGARRRAAGRPPGRPPRPRGVPRRPARPDRRCLRAGREDPRARRDACRRRGRRPGPPGTTSSASSTASSPIPTDRLRLTALETRLRGDAARLARAGPRHQARRRRRHPGLRDPPRRARGDGGRVPAGRGGRSATVTRPRDHRADPVPVVGSGGFETGASAPSSTTGMPTHDLLVDALAELLACFPVYRSYLPEGRTTSTRRSPTRAGDVPTWSRRSTTWSRCSATRSSRPRCASSRRPAR